MNFRLKPRKNHDLRTLTTTSAAAAAASRIVKRELFFFRIFFFSFQMFFSFCFVFDIEKFSIRHAKHIDILHFVQLCQKHIFYVQAIH